MFLFVRIKFLGAQGKNREPGLQKNSVRNFIGGRDPSWLFFKLSVGGLFYV